MTGHARILVIKLAALGDFVQALGPFAAIRRHHADARITLLTTKAYADFARASPYFDEVWVDSRPKAWRVGAWLDLRRRLKRGGFGRVYDLQTSDRSSGYFRLFAPGPRPEWSGIARGCSHPHANPDRDFMHTLERQAEQLAMAGIDHVSAPDLSWVEADVSRYGLEKPYALLVPGGAPHRPAKRWPGERYGELARHLAGQGVLPVLIGTEVDVIERVRAVAPEARSLAGETTFADIAALARGTVVAVGNDTGPMHLVAAAGCPSVVMYSRDSDPALCGQRGRSVTILRREALSGLPLDAVSEAMEASSGEGIERT